jgi:hypothetical protein
MEKTYHEIESWYRATTTSTAMNPKRELLMMIGLEIWGVTQRVAKLEERLNRQLAELDKLENRLHSQLDEIELKLKMARL